MVYLGQSNSKEIFTGGGCLYAAGFHSSVFERMCREWTRIFFLLERKPLTLDDYLHYDSASRGNLGAELPVIVYRMFEFALREELVQRFGKEAQVEAFRGAGRRAGEYFARHFLDMNQPMDQFIGQLQQKMQEFRIGVLRVEDVDEASGKIIFTVSEDADCSGASGAGRDRLQLR